MLDEPMATPGTFWRAISARTNASIRSRSAPWAAAGRATVSPSRSSRGMHFGREKPGDVHTTHPATPAPAL